MSDPLSPMRRRRRRIIWFCQTEAVAARPDTLARLRDEVGLTTIMPESPVCHTSGFRATEDLAARCPFRDWPSRTEAWPKAAQGIHPPVAGVTGGVDDTDLLRVIEAAHDAGIEVWGHLGLWSYGGDVYPEYAMRDVDGAPLDRRWKGWGIGLCPSRPDVNDWTADSIEDVAVRYEVDGFCVDHARYPQPANLHALIACACGHCRAAGEALGFDAPRLVEAARRTRDVLRGLDAAGVRRALAARVRGLEVLAALGAPRAFGEWLLMRAAILAARMARLRARVHAARGGIPFGSDVFAPSVGLLGGHDLGRWERATDFLTGGSSAGGVVGWATAAPGAAAAWTQALTARDPYVPEADAARLALRLLQVDDVAGLPRRADGLARGPLPTAALYAREVARLTALAGRVPLYPPVSARGDAALVRQLAATVCRQGCHGAMVTLDPDRAESLAALRQGLGSLAT